VWRESEIAVDFVHKARFRDMEDTIVSQQRFMATMQGRTATFSTFNDAQFDEAAFEAQLTSDRMPTMICWYWIVKAKARFMSPTTPRRSRQPTRRRRCFGPRPPISLCSTITITPAGPWRRSTRTFLPPHNPGGASA